MHQNKTDQKVWLVLAPSTFNHGQTVWDGPWCNRDASTSANFKERHVLLLLEVFPNERKLYQLDFVRAMYALFRLFPSAGRLGRCVTFGVHLEPGEIARAGRGGAFL